MNILLSENMHVMSHYHLLGKLKLNWHYGEVKMTASLWQERRHRLSGEFL